MYFVFSLYNVKPDQKNRNLSALWMWELTEIMTFFRQEEETILLFETITHHQMRIFQSMKVITNLLMISGTLEKYT